MITDTPSLPVMSEPTSEERIWAAISHGSVFFFGWGLIVPALVWATQRQKSAFVSFQAVQALAYQLLMPILGTLLSLLLGLLSIPLILVISLANQAQNPFLMILFQLFIFGGIFGGMGLYMLAGVLAAVLVLLKVDFRYPLLGGAIYRYIHHQPNETGEKGGRNDS